MGYDIRKTRHSAGNADEALDLFLRSNEGQLPAETETGISVGSGADVRKQLW